MKTPNNNDFDQTDAQAADYATLRDALVKLQEETCIVIMPLPHEGHPEATLVGLEAFAWALSFDGEAHETFERLMSRFNTGRVVRPEQGLPRQTVVDWCIAHGTAGPMRSCFDDLTDEEVLRHAREHYGYPG